MIKIQSKVKNETQGIHRRKRFMWITDNRKKKEEDITVYAEFERTEVPDSGHPTKSGCGSSVAGFTGTAILFAAFSGLFIIKMKRNGGKDD